MTVFCKDFGACLKYERLYSQFNKSDAAQRTLTCIFAIMQQISRQADLEFRKAEIYMHKTIKIIVELDSEVQLFERLMSYAEKLRPIAPDIGKIFAASNLSELV